MIALLIDLNAPEPHWQHLAAGSPQTSKQHTIFETANTINGAVTLKAKPEGSRRGEKKEKNRKKKEREIARNSQGKQSKTIQWQGEK